MRRAPSSAVAHLALVRCMRRSTIVVLLTCLCLSACDPDPFGLTRKKIGSGYCAVHWRQPARLRSSATGSQHWLDHFPDRMAQAVYYCTRRRRRSALGSLRYFQAQLTPAHRCAAQSGSRGRRHSCHVGRGGMPPATTSAESVVELP